MEELFFWDDRPAYPCACFFRAELLGELNRADLEAAIGRTLRSYPLLCSKVQFDSGGRLQWLVPDEPQFIICWERAGEGQQLPKARRIDLCVEIGIRFYATNGGDRSVLVIHFHHACSDALGIMRFLRDLLRACHDPHAAVQSASLNQSNPAAVPSRRNRWWPPSRMPKALWRAWQIARRKPLSLSSGELPHPDSALHEDYPTAVWETLESAETTGLARAAARQKVTFNDLLLRDLLLALAEWRPGIAGQDGWVRILVPELTESARALPGSTPDAVSTLFLDIHPNSIRSPDLLRTVHREMMEKKLAGDGDLLRLGAALDRSLGGNLARHVRANKCLFTTVFSNLGIVPMDSPEPSQSLTLESVHGVHVVRPFSPVNFMVMTVAGRLSLTMSFDSRAIQRAEADDLFQGLLGKLRESAQSEI